MLKKLGWMLLPGLLLLTGFTVRGEESAASGTEAEKGLSGKIPGGVLAGISSGERRELIEGGQVLRFHNAPAGIVPGLVPDIPVAEGMIQGIQSARLNIGVEGLFFHDSSKLPGAYSEAKETVRNLALYNILRSVSTLEGLEYYSATRGKMRVLFEKSWVLRDLSSMERIPDPLVTRVPINARMNIFQKDKSFGRNTHAMTLQAREGILLMNLVNITPILYRGLIRVVDPGKMHINMIIIPTEKEGLLVYGNMMAQTRNVKSFIKRAKNSFMNRVITLGNWYKKRLLEEFSPRKIKSFSP